MLQRLKPGLIQALIPKRAVKALDISVPGRTARLDHVVLDAVLLCPCHERTSGEFWPVVGSLCLGIAPKCRCLIQLSVDIMPANAKVGGDIYAHVRGVGTHCQAFDAP